MFDVVAVGEVLIDLTQNGVGKDGIPVFASNPGGAPANLCVAASRLGAKTSFIGKIGNDSFGKQLAVCLEENQVDVSGLVVDKKNPTTLAVVSLDSKGERSFSFYRNSSADVNLSFEEIPLQLIDTAKIVHFGSVSLVCDPERSATEKIVEYAKSKGCLISYDPNYRERLWTSKEDAVKQMKKLLGFVDVLKVSEDELPLLADTENFEDGIKVLKQKGIKLVFVTLGAKGAFYSYKDMSGLIHPYPSNVVDTNGAGDTFFGAALSKISKYASLDSLEKEDIERIVSFANKAAAHTTEHHGAIPAMPFLKDIE